MSSMMRSFRWSTAPAFKAGDRMTIVQLGSIGLPGENIVAYIDKDSKVHIEVLRRYQTGLDLGAEKVRGASLAFFVVAVQYVAIGDIPEWCMKYSNRPAILVSEID